MIGTIIGIIGLIITFILFIHSEAFKIYNDKIKSFLSNRKKINNDKCNTLLMLKEIYKIEKDHNKYRHKIKVNITYLIELNNKLIKPIELLQKYYIGYSEYIGYRKAKELVENYRQTRGY